MKCNCKCLYAVAHIRMLLMILSHTVDIWTTSTSNHRIYFNVIALPSLCPQSLLASYWGSTVSSVASHMPLTIQILIIHMLTYCTARSLFRVARLFFGRGPLNSQQPVSYNLLTYTLVFCHSFEPLPLHALSWGPRRKQVEVSLRLKNAINL